MQSFVSRHQHQIQGTLSGFDRLRFVGSLLRLSYVNGLAAFLAATGVLLKDFGQYMSDLSQRIKQAGEQLALHPGGLDLGGRAVGQVSLLPANLSTVGRLGDAGPGPVTGDDHRRPEAPGAAV